MTPDKRELIVIRPYKESDHNFILSTWLKGLRYGNQIYGLIDQKVYYEVYHKLIENILAAKGTEVNMACLKEDPDTILGYSVTRNNKTILDWNFIKAAWRGIGIGKLLTPETVKIVTHVTKTGISILKKHPEIIYNPFVL
jgi:hypothetical protein